MSLTRRVTTDWYEGASWLVLLRPLEWVYRSVVMRRRAKYLTHPEQSYRPPVPVIIVGNITVGGTGKSPLTAWLIDHLKQNGWNPGIVSRGYGGKSDEYPLHVLPNSDPLKAGDEPVMLAAQTGVPVMVDPDRSSAAKALVGLGCDIIVGDDGLQHYRLARDIEIVVIDGKRGLGNHHCLPAGPLREPENRLETVDAVIINGSRPHNVSLPGTLFESRLMPQHYRRVDNDECVALTPCPLTSPVHAVAGIGHPERFSSTLLSLGVTAELHSFPDHYQFTDADVDIKDAGSLVMTAKDAVKCRPFATDKMWSLDVRLEPESDFSSWLNARLSQWQ